MKAVLIGVGAGRPREEVMAVYPRHAELVNELVARGVVVGIGPFLGGGNLGIFRSREAAEEFVRRDPFALEGLIASYTIHDWADAMLS